MADIILRMVDIEKSFSRVRALNKACLELRAGEVHALVGENGAGKSVLMKILTGIYVKDAGTIELFGKSVELKSPAEAQKAGLAIVHQELSLMPHRTVAQNIFIGRERLKLGFIIDEDDINRRAKALFDRLHIAINPAEIIGNLAVGHQQMVEIAKAISMDARILVLDEPTAALSVGESAELFTIIEGLKAKGIGILYISHRMDEIERITDRFTVMRDGEYTGTLNTAESTRNEIIRMMVGRAVYENPKAHSTVPPNAPVALRVRGLNAGGLVHNVNFDLHKGEILGLAGLMGAGRTEMARALFGADPMESGEVAIHGVPVTIRTPRDAVAARLCYLSEDRKRYGFVPDQSVAINSTLASMEAYTTGLLLDKRKICTDAERYVQRLKTRTASVEQQVVFLSGGNQQKVVIAKWLIEDCDVLIFDEPTRGIDVGAKSEIYVLMNNLARAGKAVLMISSDLTEILRMSDRILVMHDGHITGELPIEAATQEQIMELATRRVSGCDQQGELK